MATQAASLAVKITADISGLITGTNRAGGIMHDLGGKVRAGATSFAKYGAAATAAGAAIGAALVAKSAQAGKELQNLARLADASVEDFQRMAFGARQFGIEQDKLSDILKDTKDRVGDFLNTGGGPMADFFENIAPKVGVTAEQFRKLSGPQALQLYVDSLQKAGLSQAEMTFYMEAMASDATALIPLLKDGGKALAEQAAQADKLGLVLSDLDTRQLGILSTDMAEAAGVFESFTQQLSAQLAPVLSAVWDRIKGMITDAGGLGAVATKTFNMIIKAAGFVMDAFEGVKRSFTIAADTLIWAFNEAIGIHLKQIDMALKGWQELAKLLDMPMAAHAVLSLRMFGLESTLVAIQARKNIEETLNKPMPSTALKQFVADSQAAGEAAVKALADAQAPMVGNSEINAQRQQDFDDLIEWSFKKVQAEKAAEEERTRIARMEAQNRRNVTQQVLGQTSALMNSESRKMFEVGKAAAYSQALINTYQGISEAWKLGPLLGPPMAALVALNGFAQVQNIRKQQFRGGGGGSAASAGGAGSNTQQINGNNQPVQQFRQVANITLVGDGFSRQQVQGLADQLLELRNDGSMI